VGGASTGQSKTVDYKFNDFVVNLQGEAPLWAVIVIAIGIFKTDIKGKEL
jgi:hypothetical protein